MIFINLNINPTIKIMLDLMDMALMYVILDFILFVSICILFIVPLGYLIIKRDSFDSQMEFPRF